MDFIDQVKQFAKRVESLKDTIQTEEATKTAIIMPFFAMLGYDVFNPQEFIPEFTADVGIKKGEKVDYAVVDKGVPIILVEAKSISENLERHDSQLYRYFGTTKAKFAILTNGLIYRFYTDLEEANKMDETPFMEVNILNIKENQFPELKKFHKSVFNETEILDTASVLKYAGIFKESFAAQLQAPTDDFIKLFLQDAYSGMKTQTVVEKFRPIIKKSLNDFINETMSDKIKSALGASMDSDTQVAQTKPAEDTTASEEADSGKEAKVVTTIQEMEAFFILKNALRNTVPPSDITYKDTTNYFACLYKGNTRKWICRLIMKNAGGFIILPTKEKTEVKFAINSPYDINNYKDQLIEIVTRYMEE